MKPKVAGNKLAKLGILGVVGMLGLWAKAPVFMVFFLFFFFFAFINMPPDELFWQHVHKAGLRALATYLTLSSCSFFFSAIRVSIYQFGMEQFEHPTQEFVEHLFLEAALTTVIFIVTLCVFVFTLMYFIRKEKKGLDTPEVVADAKDPA